MEFFQNTFIVFFFKYEKHWIYIFKNKIFAFSLYENSKLTRPLHSIKSMNILALMKKLLVPNLKYLT